MPTRLWRGWTAGKDADACERFLRTERFPSMPDIPESTAPACRAVTQR
jgi:hypothetical protein